MIAFALKVLASNLHFDPSILHFRLLTSEFSLRMAVA